MTVSTVVNHEQYDGNGTTTVFPYRFRILKASHMVVTVSDTSGALKTLALGTDYSLTGVGLVSGGNVVLNTALASGWQLSLDRDLPAVQETDLRNQGKFFAETHEDAFDYLTMLIQRAMSSFGLALRKPSWIAKYYDAQNNRISNLANPVNTQDASTKTYSDSQFVRTIRVPESSVNQLPTVSDRANKVLAFNNNGQPMPVLPQSGSATDVMIELAKPTGSSLIGTADGNTVQSKIDGFDTFMIANDSASFRSKNISKLASVNYKIRTRAPLSVLFQGDSITAGYDVSTTDTVAPENGDWARHATMTYPKRFVDFMSEQCGITVNPVYRAISGYTAKDAFNDVNWQINPNCDMVFLMYGINDANGMHDATYASYMENMEKLIRRLINWGMGVVVMTCAAGGQGANNPLFQVWVQQVKELATIYGCAHFDAHEVHYNRLYGVVQSDSTHFNSMGYAKLGESLVSMCAAGGLLSSYESVKHEVQVWPGAQDKHIGYTNPQNNVSLGFNSGAFTNPGITGTLPANQRCVMAFHFYQDCEALDVDIIGMWDDGGLSFILDNWYSPGTVEYYPLSARVNNERGLGFRTVLTSGALNNQDNSRNGQPKFIGTLYGKGWKTITIYNKLDGSSPNPQYLQMLTLRPVSVRKANPSRKGFQIGGIASVRAMLPESIRGSVPDAVSLSSMVIPLPESLKGIARDNRTAYFDCATARVMIKAIAGTFGNHYLEGVLFKSGANVDSFNFIITTQTGAVSEWPIFTFTKSQKNPATSFTANQLGPNMPERAIVYGQSDVANGAGNPSMGDWLTISANWSSVTGGAKTAYWSIEIWGLDFDGSPVISAL